LFSEEKKKKKNCVKINYFSLGREKEKRVPVFLGSQRGLFFG
jgi:hypothetical protein